MKANRDASDLISRQFFSSTETGNSWRDILKGRSSLKYLIKYLTRANSQSFLFIHALSI